MGLVNKPHTFVNKNNADPSQVNNNFDVLYTLVNGKLDENNLDFSLATVKNSILTALKGVDGHGSGLNADLLDDREYTEISTEIDNKINNALNDAQNYSDGKISDHLPAGIITMWSGSIASIPPNWKLCNGENGTPDLRNKFIVAAGDSYTVGNTGGVNSVSLSTSNLPSHYHSSGSLSTTTVADHDHNIDPGGNHKHTGTTAPDGEHRHRYTDYSPSGNTHNLLHRSGADEGSVNTLDTYLSGDHSHSFNTSTVAAHTHNADPAGSHSHSISGSTASTGGGSSHENRPPYYALAYIMKI